MQIKDKRISEQEFGLNLNLDDSEKALTPGDCTYALNCISKDGNIGKVTNEKGNTLIAFTLNAGTNRCVLTSEDNQNNAILFGVFNSNGDHSIYRYNITENTVEIIILGLTILDFIDDGRNGLITHARVVDGLLIWPDGRGEPKLINIERARKLEYPVLDEEAINLIKTPPWHNPTAEFINNYDRTLNFVKNKQWQFAYRYIFLDDQKSVFSPISPIPYPTYDLLLERTLTALGPSIATSQNTGSYLDTSGVIDGDGLMPDIWNGIQLTIKVGHETCTKIEIIVKDLAIGVWYSLIELDNTELLQTYSPDDDYSDYIFYNENIGPSISDDDLNRTMDLVPRAPKYMEYISDNRLVFLNFLDGFDLIDLDVSGSVISTEQFSKPSEPINSLDRGSPFYSFSIPTSSISPEYNNTLFIWDDLDVAQAKFELGDVIHVYFEPGPPLTHVPTINQLTTPIMTYYITNEDLISLAKFKEGVIRFCDEQGWQNTWSQADTRVSIITGGKTAVNGWTVSGTYTDIYTFSPNTRNTFKEGGYQQFGLVYFGDGGRHSSVITDDNWKIKIPLRSEISPIGSFSIFTHKIDLEINHQPPDWALWYQVVYAGSVNIKDSLTLIKPSDYLDPTSDGRVLSNRGWVLLVTFLKAIVKTYEFVVGDFVRKLSENSASVKQNQPRLVSSYDEDTGRIDTETRVRTSDLDVYEVFKEATESDEQKFYEWGLCFKIGNPGQSNRYHKGLSQDQNTSYTQPAKIRVDRGDAWLKSVPKVWGIADVSGEEKIKVGVFWVNDFWYSDFYVSNHNGFGRPYGQNEDFKETNEVNLIRYSGKYFEGTKVNELNTFRVDSEAALNIKFGEGTGLIEVGYVLKAFQQRKVNSIYVGRQAPVNPDGSEDILLTDKILGTIVPSNDDWGTEFPESILKHDRHVYFFDHNFGAYIRDAANGMTPVSEYKAASKFKALGEAIKGADRNEILCLSTWNEDIRCVVFSAQSQITKGVELPSIAFVSFTISFNEDQNRWKSFHPYLPEAIRNLGNTIVSFVDGKLYLHNSNEVRGEFYGSKHPMRITVPSNLHPDKVKAFHSIALQTNKKWSVPMIHVNADDQSEIKRSRLKETDFEYVEGNFYSALKKNYNSPEFSGNESITFRLANGEEMRGNVGFFEIENNHNEEVTISRVIIISTPSELSD